MMHRICQSPHHHRTIHRRRSMKRRSATVPTRERILNEVERLIALKGVYGFTLRDVADRIGLRVPAIYKHYTGRDDVLVEVSRRFITLLAAQFHPSPTQEPPAALRSSLNRLVEFKLFHPAYVRLALVDFATPEGGMEYVKRAAGGSFQDNFSDGPLAAMQGRLRSLLQAGARTKHFRRVDVTDFYRLVEAALLMRLVFPDDQLLLRRPTAAEVRAIQRWLWNIASGFLAPRPAGRRPS
jgi:AcrR family transcriptional regulator